MNLYFTTQNNTYVEMKYHISGKLHPPPLASYTAWCTWVLLPPETMIRSQVWESPQQKLDSSQYMKSMGDTFYFSPSDLFCFIVSAFPPVYPFALVLGGCNHNTQAIRRWRRVTWSQQTPGQSRGQVFLHT